MLGLDSGDLGGPDKRWCRQSNRGMGFYEVYVTRPASIFCACDHYHPQKLPGLAQATRRNHKRGPSLADRPVCVGEGNPDDGSALKGRHTPCGPLRYPIR